MRGARTLAVTSAASALVGAAVAAVIAVAVVGTGRTSVRVSDPCTQAWAHQQDATSFRAAGGEAARLARFQSVLAVGTLATGVCLRTDTEFHQSGWTITSIAVTATGHGEEGLPVTFSRRGTDVSEDLGLLWVPLAGCVDVEGTITAKRTGPAATATWTATRSYGRGCARAPGHGAYQDDGTLVRPSPS
ncbi:hypothetical protein P5P86_19990 [Nocardioides sp. BP30]|uniref:hypothetical protein n=1 Tax=Nocardioides sp. BP30 TaxID=3036374 RepID=UPI002469BA3C|nr:hypothetical protein [Nocardioides sp. BP30]WGL52219.1 hypothetical protein P5P86_19990 [Nocardioides sp. BP30]